jgi:hypothetical protein
MEVRKEVEARPLEAVGGCWGLLEWMMGRIMGRMMERTKD